MNTRITKALFPSKSTMSESDMISPSQLKLFKFTTPTSSKRGGEQSTRSRRPRSAYVGGCVNCKKLEKLFQTERKACHNAAMNAAEAMKGAST